MDDDRDRSQEDIHQQQPATGDQPGPAGDQPQTGAGARNPDRDPAGDGDGGEYGEQDGGEYGEQDAEQDAEQDEPDHVQEADGAEAGEDDWDDEAEDDDEPPDLEHRLLCSDGMCIGIISPDGKCNECGKPYEGDPEEIEQMTAAAEHAAEKRAAEEQTAALDRSDREAAKPLDFSDRTLCSDGMCIGIIGPDGNCNECGKPYEITD